ncbi:MAG: nuclear transport factor 2 family protein [Paracoccaceae bacterium]
MTKRFAAALVAATTLSAPAMADMVEISRTITDIAAGADRHDWARVRDAFSDSVTVDYTSLWGGEPATQAADDLVAGWQGFLPGFDMTHHMVTNHTVVSQDGDSALVQAEFTATHRVDDMLWTLGGRYTYEMKPAESRWRVTSLTMTALWETGDRGIVAIASERAAAN